MANGIRFDISISNLIERLVGKSKLAGEVGRLVETIEQLHLQLQKITGKKYELNELEKYLIESCDSLAEMYNIFDDKFNIDLADAGGR